MASTNLRSQNFGLYEAVAEWYTIGAINNNQPIFVEVISGLCMKLPEKLYLMYTIDKMRYHYHLLKTFIYKIRQLGLCRYYYLSIS